MSSRRRRGSACWRKGGNMAVVDAINWRCWASTSVRTFPCPASHSVSWRRWEANSAHIFSLRRLVLPHRPDRIGLHTGFNRICLHLSISSAHSIAIFLNDRKSMSSSDSIRLFSSHQRWASRKFSTNWSRRILSRSSLGFGTSRFIRLAISTNPWAYAEMGLPAINVVVGRRNAVIIGWPSPFRHIHHQDHVCVSTNIVRLAANLRPCRPIKVAYQESSRHPHFQVLCAHDSLCLLDSLIKCWFV